MSYLVLARKWRPRSFDTLVGQEHVVRALTHALETQRLHHAWLFTGTRGVGKTTLSRILAKALNCEQGITPNPCGQCSACTEIDAGRFVDYIELDAASNRGVDEMTQLLEQAVYSPSSGRFKVYMIDEVHMLSGHAFNAMLKTLEEPPPHVKFILATTDPQKIPVTVLSRCLQFNLKQMTAESIISYLEKVLKQENIPYEDNALRLLARAASGSMRDALSLTDQAISYSADNLTSDSIQAMLGTIDQNYLTDLLEGLSQSSATKVIEVANALATMGLSYSAALDDLAVLLSRIAIEQRIPGSVPVSDTAAEQIKNLAHVLSTDMVQLFYSVAVHSRSELSLAPDEYAGFVMACFRMMALLPPGTERKPETEKKSPEPITEAPTEAKAIKQQVSSPEPVKPVPAPIAESADASAVASNSSVRSKVSQEYLPEPQAEPEPEPESHADQSGMESYEDIEPYAYAEAPAAVQPIANFEQPQKNIKQTKKGQANKVRSLLADLDSDAWPKLVNQLPLSGAAAELARQSEFIKVDGNLLYLRMGIDVLGEISARSHLATVLSEYYGTVVRLDFEYAKTGSSTAFAIDQAHLEKLQQQALVNVQNDAFINELITEFQAYVVEGSVRPVL